MSFEMEAENITSFKNISDGSGGPVHYYDYYYYFDFKEFFSAFRFRLDIFLWKYMSLVITVLSLFGNVLVFMVLLRKKNRNFSTSVFIMNLAFADIFVCMSAFEGFLTINKLVIPTYSDFDCKFRMFLPKATQYVSVWMLVFISIERALSVRLPHRVKLIFTLKFARILVIIVWVLAIAKTSVNAGQIHFQEDITGSPSCFNTMSRYPVLYYIDLFFYTMLAVLVPYPIILTCTFITISTLLQNTLRKSKSNKSELKSITVTLIIVNVVYLLSVSPTVVYEVYTVFWVRFNSYINWTIVDYLNYIALLNIFTFVSFLHNALNFFIYFLNGSRFRAETKDMILSCFSQKSGKSFS